MSYKEDLNKNNGLLQNYIDALNVKEGDNNSFIPVDSGENTFKARLNDNNIDLETILELCKNLPQNNFIKILYEANGGKFNNNEIENLVVYKFKNDSPRIVKTPNISTDGIATEGYDMISSSLVNVVAFPDADSLQVQIQYSTEDLSDYIEIYDNMGNLVNMCTGSPSGPYEYDSYYEETFIVEGDTAQFIFYSDGYDSYYYGYYAIVTPIYGNSLIVEGEELIPTRSSDEIFAGWYLEATCNNKLNFNALNYNRKAYAKYVPMLIDFTYTYNERDNSYTLQDWKGTLYGEPSTELIIPDDSRIIL